MSDTHEVHTSEMRSFLGCRRRWDWASRQRIVPEIPIKPLEFGIAFHIAMQTFYDPLTWSTTSPEEKTKRAVQEFVAECERQRSRYLKVTGQTALLHADGDDYTERIDLGIGMLEWYGLQVHPQQDTWFRPVMVEVPFQVPICIPGTKIPLTCKAPPVSRDHGPEDECLRTCGQTHEYGAVVTFDGRIDAIMEDVVNGGYLLWDHKSAAAIRKHDRLLHLDPQVNGYTWAATIELEIDIRGFLYVEYRKDYPKPPDLLSRPYKGRRFSTNKQAATDLKNFTQTVQRYDPDGWRDGRYDEHVAWLQSPEAPVFHKRFSILKTHENLKSVAENIYRIASDMVDPSLSIYPNAGTYSCSGCAYYDPCLSQFLGEDYNHALSSSTFKKV